MALAATHLIYVTLDLTVNSLVAKGAASVARAAVPPFCVTNVQCPVLCVPCTRLVNLACGSRVVRHVCGLSSHSSSKLVIW